MITVKDLCVGKLKHRDQTALLYKLCNPICSPQLAVLSYVIKRNTVYPSFIFCFRTRVVRL